MTYLGHQIDDIWDAIYTHADSITLSSDSIETVKGIKHALEYNPQIYVTFSGASPTGAGQKDRKEWTGVFDIYIFRSRGELASADEDIQTITGGTIDTLESDLQLSDLVHTLTCEEITPQFVAGFERANAQLRITVRFDHYQALSPTYTGDGTIPSDTDVWWQGIIDKLDTEIQKAGISDVYQSDRGLRDVHPITYIISKNLVTTPLTTQKTLSDLAVDIVTFTMDSNLTTSEVEALQYTGRIIDEILDDPRLGSTCDGVIPVGIIPHWGGMMGYEESCYAARMKISTIR